MSRPSKKKTIQVRPPITDAIPPFLEAREKYKLDEARQQRVLETLGVAIYKSRQKKNPKAPILLTALPEGYYVEYTSYYRYAGHPSKILFNSTSSFLTHLLWLEDMSHPDSIQPRRKCKCIICKQVRNKGTVRRKTQVYDELQDDSYHELTSDDESSDDESSPEIASTSVEPAMPEPAKPGSLEPVSRESTPDDSKSIRVYPLKKVLIERYVNPHYYYPDKLTIPLPEIQKSDESILLKSLRP